MLDRISRIGRAVFFGLFASLVLPLFIRGSIHERSFVQLTVILVFCVIVTCLCQRNKEVLGNLGLLQLLISPLLLYTLISIAQQFNTNFDVASVDLIKNTNDSFFHSLKEFGISAVDSLYLLLAIPLATLLTEKIYIGVQTIYYFVLGEQEPESSKSIRHITTLLDGVSSPFKNFFGGFTKGFAMLTFSFLEVARYLVIVYSLSFLSIAFLSYWHFPPALSQNVPEPALPYWFFMNTFVAGAVWTMYLLRKTGRGHIEKFYLQFFFSFLIIGGSVSALAVILAPERLRFLTLSLPPITLIGIVLCMFSLRDTAIVLLRVSNWTKLSYFLAGSTLAVVPSLILTYSPFANYTWWVIYVWSSGAAGIAVYSYLLSGYADQHNARVIAVLAFAAFEAAYLSRLFELDLLAQSLTQWGSLIWIPSLILGVAGAILWKQHAVVSTVLMALGWVAYVLFSGSWFYVFALLHGVALSYLWTGQA